MLRKKTHLGIAKAIRNANINETSRYLVAKPIADFFEKDNPATFDRQQFYDIVTGKLNYLPKYIKDEL